MNRSQLDQELESIHGAAIAILEEKKNGCRKQVIANHLDTIIHGTNALLSMMDMQPDDECAPCTFKELRKEALAALYESRRRGGGRQAMIAYRISRLHFGANNALIELGQAI